MFLSVLLRFYLVFARVSYVCFVVLVFEQVLQGLFNRGSTMVFLRIYFTHCLWFPPVVVLGFTFFCLNLDLR